MIEDLTKRITVRLKEEEYQELKNISEESNMKIGLIVRNAIRNFLTDYKIFRNE